MKYIKKVMLILTILTLFVVTKNAYAAPTTTTTTPGTTGGTAGTTTTTTTTAPTTTTTTGTGTTTTPATTTTPTTAGTSATSNPGITTTTTTAVPDASSTKKPSSGGLDPFSYDPNNADNPNVDIDEISKRVNPIYNILMAIIVIAAVVSLTIIGLKLITASVEEKAEYKQHLIPVATGIIIAAFLFSGLVVLAKFAQIF